MMKLLKFLFLTVILLSFNAMCSQKQSQRKRRSKEIEDKVNRLDEATKQRVLAMKASGMPRDAIAEKIAYVAGNKNTAGRIVDAIQEQANMRQATKAKLANKGGKSSKYNSNKNKRKHNEL
jgi:hypothetical protein